MTSSILLALESSLAELLEPYDSIQAAALYGSTVRGDAEHYSDIDLLVVCRGGDKRDLYDSIYPVLSKHFERLSLSIYSPREVDFLVKAHSLFLLHLQRESRLLFDRNLVLTSAIGSFECKASYDDDFQQSLELLAPLRSVVFGAPNNLHRLAYTYTLFRVYGVYMLARYKIFEFSKARMAACLTTLHADQADCVALLSQLRVLNANFFSGGKFDQETLRELLECPPALDACITALGRLVGKRIAVSRKTYSDAVREFVDAAQNHPYLGYRLRTWFLLLVYDGLNLFCQSHKTPTLTLFSADRLVKLAVGNFPLAVRDAALQSLEYLRNYPLKYFLLEESKIPLERACTVLTQLSGVTEDRAS